MWEHSPQLIFLSPGKRHVALGLWMLTTDRDLEDSRTFLQQQAMGQRTCKQEGAPAPTREACFACWQHPR